MKKDKQGRHCHEQQKNSPFILSVHGMMGKEAQVVLATLSQFMIVKMEEPNLQVKGWVKIQIAISFTRS